MADSVNMGKGRFSWNVFKKAIHPYLWFLPMGVIVCGILLYPWLWSLYLSLHSWSPLRPGSPLYIGLTNYLEVLTDPGFWNSVRITVELMVLSVGGQFIIGFALALLLNRIRKGRGVFVSILMLPMMLTPSVIGLIWKFLLHGEWGTLNYFISLVGLEPLKWMSDPSVTLYTVSLISIWQNMPFVMLVLLAGLQTVPQDLMDASRVDGATGLQSFRYIILPWLRPLMNIALMFRVVFALRTFDVVYSMWRSGGPGKSAQVLGVYLYEEYRWAWAIGRSSAISYILLGITFLFSLVFARDLLRRERT